MTAATLKAAFGRFATGVAFVAADIDGRLDGLVVSSFAAVSLAPPLVSFCPARTSRTWQRMRAADELYIHVLDARDRGFARAAAAPGADRFADLDPLRRALAVLDCVPYAEHDAGDHTIMVARVRSVQLADRGEPLVYFAGELGRFSRPGGS